MRRFPVLLAVLPFVLLGCSDVTAPPSDPAKETYASSLNVNITTMTKVTPDLYIRDSVVGTGAAAANGQTLGVVYSGYLVNGTKFDSNVGKATFSFLLGFGMVIEGWDKGLVGMKVGGIRRLVIGSALGYGKDGSPPVIPGNATLVFDVQLVSVK